MKPNKIGTAIRDAVSSGVKNVLAIIGRDAMKTAKSDGKAPIWYNAYIDANGVERGCVSGIFIDPNGVLLGVPCGISKKYTVHAMIDLVFPLKPSSRRVGKSFS